MDEPSRLPRLRATIATLLVVTLLAAGAFVAPARVPGARASEGELAAGHLVHDPIGGRTMVWHGNSSIHLAGACLAGLLGLCLGDNSTQDGRFFLPVSGHGGRVLAWWQPANDTLRELRVTVGQVSVVGESPIEIDLPGATAGVYAIHAEPNRTVVGAYDQTVSWTATFHLDPLPARVDQRGVATYRALAPCALVCNSTPIDQKSDGLVVPWKARGILVADWDPAHGPREITVESLTVSVQGPPPLVLRIDAIEPGLWDVLVAPQRAGPLERGQIEWRAELERA